MKETPEECRGQEIISFEDNLQFSRFLAILNKVPQGKKKKKCANKKLCGHKIYETKILY